ncbi:hypothetical protein Barb6_00102 [Bacteroidales bacterium Barb6]|nr:hypothetical protein Barb6_00102 [Bacteroidales bacterium Barb6]
MTAMIERSDDGTFGIYYESSSPSYNAEAPLLLEFANRQYKYLCAV